MPKLSAAVVLALVATTACGCAVGAPTSVSASLTLLAATASATSGPTPAPTPTGTPSAMSYVTGASTRAASTVSGGAEVTTDDTPEPSPVFGVPGGYGNPGTYGDAGTATATTPGALLDLASWYLTLPTGTQGHPDTVSQPALAAYSSQWFQLDSAGDGIVFTADAGGVTTANSGYPRSELREMDGTAPASWSNETGTHTMTLRQAVLALPPNKPEVVTAQIHDAVSDVMEIRLEGSRLIAQYSDGHRDFTLDPSYVLGTPYDLMIVAAQGRIDVYYNGNHSGGFAEEGSNWYFKTGSYVQSNVAHGDASDAMGQVVLYALRVEHSS